MNQGHAVFSQLISFLPDREFRRCVERYQGDSRLRGFSCWDQYLSMAFAQLTYRESLRDIEACLHSVEGKLYDLGFRGKVARSTLADANESHDWRIFADFAQVLIRIARPLYAHDEIGVDLDQSLYALDSTTIDLCLSLFPWAKFRQRKAAVKMHPLLDWHGNIPTFIRVTSRDVHDSNILDEIMPEAGAFCVMDRGYIDFPEALCFYTQLRFLRRPHQWEKIVLNLASNAFKFTFEEEISVSLAQIGTAAELRIRDSGVGIPSEEIPRLFDRFHRVPNTRSRTHEGSGIGPALVNELVKLHSGSLRVESALGQGSTFMVTIPLGQDHLALGQIGGERALASTATGANPFLQEALRWLPETEE